ncbi:phage tail domain-containing protein [Bacillus wiedmannii]|uniref:Phage tail family protein n=1 Tax=Bacillus wiedmannii TaxID=1890302 RepID=A0ABX5DNH6_9BACI|nr:phage tail domain-containing protein [Bacillus wiedmannii]PRT35506.1 phage tail family protein [Bacillus wiedmannii]
MSEQTLTIVKENGESFVISTNENMRVLTFLPSSPFFNTVYEKVTGMDGSIDLGGSFDAQDSIKSRIFFRSKNIDAFYLFRNQIYDLFDSQEPFYIISSRTPEKRWNVKVAYKYEIEPKGNGKYGVFDIVFKSDSPFSESIYTTLESNSSEYVYNSSSFAIYNAGKKIDPRSPHTPLLITFKGASDKLRIINKTTGDEWTYNGKTTAEDVIRLDRVRSTKNSLSIVRDTNKKIISLNAGVNEVEITGATGAFSISFDFRFYYF